MQTKAKTGFVAGFTDAEDLAAAAELWAIISRLWGLDAELQCRGVESDARPRQAILGLSRQVEQLRQAMAEPKAAGTRIYYSRTARRMGERIAAGMRSSAWAGALFVDAVEGEHYPLLNHRQLEADFPLEEKD